MHWIFWLILFQVAFGIVYGEIRDRAIRDCVKSKGFKFVVISKSQKISGIVTAILQTSIPFFGSVICIMMLLLTDEQIFNELRKSGRIKRADLV